MIECVSLRAGMISASLATACVTGGPATSASTSVTAGSVGETSDATTGDASSSGESSTGDSGGTMGAEATSSGSSSEAPAPSCSDLAMNGDETDVDCGGSCPACGDGLGCTDAMDCASAQCDGETCCAVSTYDRSTGLVSGSAMVCCDGDDVRLSLIECGDGMNYSIAPVRPNCASTSEGAMNNGSACVSITCQRLDCTPA